MRVSARPASTLGRCASWPPRPRPRAAPPPRSRSLRPSFNLDRPPRAGPRFPHTTLKARAAYHARAPALAVNPRTSSRTSPRLRRRVDALCRRCPLLVHRRGGVRRHPRVPADDDLAVPCMRLIAILLGVFRAARHGPYTRCSPHLAATASMSSCLAKPPSTCISRGYSPQRSWTCSTSGATGPCRCPR